MLKRKYSSPILFEQSSGGNGSVVGDGTGQGSIPPNMTYDEWWDEVAWGGENPDADYNRDGKIDEADYHFYIDNHLWDPDE